LEVKSSGRHRAHRVIRTLAVALTVSFALGSALARTPLAQPVVQGKDVVAPAATPIPVPEVARRAEEAAALLRQVVEHLATDHTASDVETRLPGADEWVTVRLSSTREMLAASHSPEELANLTDSWTLMRSQLAAWNELLARRTTKLEHDLAQFESARATWSVSRDAALASRAPAPVLDRITTTLAAVAATRSSVVDERTRILGLQDRVAREVARCDDALATIAQAGEMLGGPLLVRDAPPIWSGQAPAPTRTELTERMRNAVIHNTELTRQYLAAQLPRVAIQVALFGIVLVLACRGRAGAQRRGPTDPGAQAGGRVLELPVSCGLLLALLATEWIYPLAPRAITNLVSLLILVPAVRITLRLVSPAVVPAVYALAACFMIDRLREVSAAIAALEQPMFLLEMILGIAFLALAVRSQRRAPAAGDGSSWWRPVVVWVLRFQLVLVVVALGAGGLGFMRLARHLGSSAVASSYLALVLYAGVQVGEVLAASVLRSRPLSEVFLVQRNREMLQRRVRAALGWLAAGTWVYVTLDRLGVMAPLWSAGFAALDARYVRGAVSVSVGDVLAFALTIGAAFVVSSVLRFVLEEEVYPRVGLPRGLPYALSSLSHYVVVLLGLMLGLAALGLDLTHITILAGAFGVGIGIGLQSVVANFVSGLILLLERRIHVGDAIETAELGGEVREIGFRATTIRTYDGADVIVPNGKLTGERVINWTLSDRLRRVSVSVPVVYAADPARVLGILTDTAQAYPKTLAKPAPAALCTGFRDNALNFELRVWIGGYEDSDRVRSDLAVALHTALAAAGIELALSVPRELT
jgi:potassium-dependent mechanosensitive channel